MKKIILDENDKKKVLTYSLSGVIVVIVALVLFNIGTLVGFIQGLINVLSPFLWGVVFAFVMSKFANFVEKILPSKISFKLKRFVSSFVSILLLIVIIVAIALLVAPQLGESVGKLSNVMMTFSANPTEWVKKVEMSSNLPEEVITMLYNYSNTLVSSIWTFLETNIANIVGVTINTVSGVLNFVIGFIVALYMLMDREKIINGLKKFFKAFLSEKHYVKMTIVYNVAVTKFYRFFQGKLLDSLIIGVLCFVIMTILKLDFAMLISVVVLVTNIIPFFGPFIGAIPSILILLMIDPTQALIFAILIFVLQQIDGNIIGPAILGDSVGLSSLWIMFAIIVGGAYFGFFGMLLGVPIFSVIYYLINEEIDRRLNTK